MIEIRILMSFMTFPNSSDLLIDFLSQMLMFCHNYPITLTLKHCNLLIFEVYLFIYLILYL